MCRRLTKNVECRLLRLCLALKGFNVIYKIAFESRHNCPTKLHAVALSEDSDQTAHPLSVGRLISKASICGQLGAHVIL